MAAEALARAWTGPSRRRVPRFPVQAPMDVIVLRSGIPDTVPGRTLNLCERGIAAIMAGELVAGEAVGIEVQLPPLTTLLRSRAMVRYQDKLRCGLEFVGLSAEQKTALREWAKDAKGGTETRNSSVSPIIKKTTDVSAEIEVTPGTGVSRESWKKRLRGGWIIVLIFVTLAAAVVWWRWNLGWQELESGLKGSEMPSAEKPQARVPAEVMQKLLVHRVEPTYPAEARKENLQGIIALDIVVGRDGSVVSMHPLNGPEVLARAAMDALRWWKFEPYRLNGEPSTVETTLAVEFKR